VVVIVTDPALMSAAVMTFAITNPLAFDPAEFPNSVHPAGFLNAKPWSPKMKTTSPSMVPAGHPTVYELPFDD
jgi:hypothetical protein